MVYPQEAAHLTVAASARQAEFLTGRACARQALAQVGAAAGPIAADAEGLPQWPQGFLASITHSRGLAAAVGARVEQFSYLGLDLEKTNRLSDAALRRVVHSDEAKWVGQDQWRASLLFSAKEAFYKAQYPRWRCTANFTDLCFEVDTQTRQLQVREIAERFAPELRAVAGQLQFRYASFEDYVVSLCWL